MNVDIENQENFEKKKKIIIISLSAALVFITLIAGLFWVKKNKESNHKNNDIEKVINNNVNDNDNEKPNSKGTIANEDEYFFNRTSGQVTMNILLFLVVGILFFFWENDKLPIIKGPEAKSFLGNLRNYFCGRKSIMGIGLFEKANWFGFATLFAVLIITLLVEFILHLLIGSLSHLLSKDKSKKYFHTLKMSLKKRIKIFSSFSKIKTLFIVLSYLLYAVVIAIVARVVRKFHPCCNDEIIKNHGRKCCLCYCEVRKNDNFKDYSYLLKQKIEREKKESKRIYDEKIEKAKKENEKKDALDKRIADTILSQLTEDDIERIEGIVAEQEEAEIARKKKQEEAEIAKEKKNKIPGKKLEVKKDEENKKEKDHWLDFAELMNSKKKFN